MKMRALLLALPPVALVLSFILGMAGSWQHMLPGPVAALWLVVPLPFLVVGSLLWCACQQRLLASLFFIHCALVAGCFVFLPVAVESQTLLLLGALGAVICLFHLIGFLPRQYLAALAEEAPGHLWRWRVIRILTDSGGGIGGVCAIFLVSSPLSARWMEGWLVACVLLYLGVGGWWSWKAYRGTEEPREREQLRLVALSILVAVLPPLLLLGLPRVFRLPGDPLWLSLLSLPLFPLVLGYAILRFQLLVPDRIIQRVALWLGRGICLPLVVILLVRTGLTLFTGPGLVFFLAVSLTCLSVLVWWGTGRLVSQLFIHELPSLAAFLRQPPSAANLEEAAELLGSALSLASGSRQVCLCLNLDSQRVFAPMPALASPRDPRGKLLEQMRLWWDISEYSSLLMLPEPVFQDLCAHNWLAPEDKHALSRFPRRLAPQKPVRLLALPIRLVEGEPPIALALLGPAEDGHPYVGDDLERLLQITERAARWLAQARQREETRRQDWLLGQIYTGLTQLPLAPEPRATVAGYAELMASFGTSIEIYSTEGAAQEEPWLRAGHGPWLSVEEREQIPGHSEGPAHFCSSGEGSWSCAFASFLLTFSTASARLIVTYPHPYHFGSREQEYWQIVVRHCQDRLEVLAHQAQRTITEEAWVEQVQLVTALAGAMDLLSQDTLSDTQRGTLLEVASRSVKQLRKGSVR